MKSIYTLIGELQQTSFTKYGSYAHSSGMLGAMLEGVVSRLPQKEQAAYKEYLERTILEISKEKEAA